MVNGKESLHEKAVFAEHELAVRAPLQAAYADAFGARESHFVKAAGFDGHKRARHAAVRIVVERCGIRRGAAENAERSVRSELHAHVSAVQGVQARRPGQIEAAHTCGPAR